MRSSLILLMFLAGSSAAFAQTQPISVQVAPSTPAMEFGVHLDLVGALGGGDFVGGRISKRYQDWLLTEWTFDKRTWENDPREARFVVSSVRLQVPDAVFGKRPFVTAGLAAAHGLSFRWSPVFGAGVQHEMPDQIVSFRAEIQYFVRGQTTNHYDRSRILLGLTVGIP